MISIPDLLLVKILNFFNLYQVLYNPDLTSGTGIILPVNAIMRSAKSKSLNGGFLLFCATNDTTHLGNF